MILNVRISFILQNSSLQFNVQQCIYSQARAISHIPVLLEEVCESFSHLKSKSDSLVIDGTFGGGGHSTAILERFPNTKLLAFDRDASVFERPGINHLLENKRFNKNVAKFSEWKRFRSLFGKVDAILLDLGMSSIQLDTANRGFSFKQELDGPLDMRMNTNGETTANCVVNKFSQDEIASIIYNLGDERNSRKIAKAIVTERENTPITTTHHLASIVRSAFPKKKVITSKIDVATKTFQALRMFVNDELQEVKEVLKAAECFLKPGGRLSIISFHSGEDKLVKDMLYYLSGRRDWGNRNSLPSFELLGKIVTPSDKEIELNPRSRSSKMRMAQRTSSPPINSHYFAWAFANNLLHPFIRIDAKEERLVSRFKNK